MARVEESPTCRQRRLRADTRTAGSDALVNRGRRRHRGAKSAELLGLLNIPPRSSATRSTRGHTRTCDRGALLEPSGRNRWQPVANAPSRNRLRSPTRQPFATPRNDETFDGKEGVDGSSPSEGLQNPRSRGFFVQDDLLFVVRAVGMEPFMELSRSRGDLFRAKEEVGSSRHRGS
jgi:hypothetical protein